LPDFNLFESHGGGFIFAVTAFGVLFGLFEHEHRGQGSSVCVALAALKLRSAGGVFADEFALGLGTFGLVALPVALGLFTDGFAFGFGDLAVGDAVGGLADGHALGAVFHLAGLVGAHDLAVGSFALDVAHSVFRLLAAGVALGRFADGGTDGVTPGIVAFPGTLGVALLGQLAGNQQNCN